LKVIIADDDAPNAELGIVIDTNVGILRIFRMKVGTLPRWCAQTLDCHLSVDHCDDDIAIVSGERAVHKQKIAVEDACAFHGIAGDCDGKGGIGMLDDISVKGKLMKEVVLRDGREARVNGFEGSRYAERNGCDAQASKGADGWWQ
jgi:hypothetical protein